MTKYYYRHIIIFRLPRHIMSDLANLLIAVADALRGNVVVNLMGENERLRTELERCRVEAGRKRWCVELLRGDSLIAYGIIQDRWRSPVYGPSS